MKRICILPVFDKDGIFDESVLFFIRSLSEVVDRLILVVIGEVTEESLAVLKTYTNEILIKENRGLDAGAVKYCFKNDLSLDKLHEYDELVIANDTNFGPFIPFAQIFATMQKKSCDYWGMNFIDTNLMPHIQSDFRVFRHSTFDFLYDYIMHSVDENEAEKSNVVMNYEFRMYKKLREAGFKSACWGKGNDVYFLPYNSLVAGHPLLKVRSFSFYNQNPEQYNEAVEFVGLKNRYNTEWIVSKIKRKYGITISAPVRRSLGNYSVSEKEFENFVLDSEGFYIYGAGSLAKQIFQYYRESMQELKGFVVSDKSNVKDKELFGFPILSVSELSNTEAKIVVAMSEQNSIDVAPLLKNFRNTLFLHEVKN